MNLYGCEILGKIAAFEFCHLWQECQLDYKLKYEISVIPLAVNKYKVLLIVFFFVSRAEKRYKKYEFCKARHFFCCV